MPLSVTMRTFFILTLLNVTFHTHILWGPRGLLLSCSGRRAFQGIPSLLHGFPIWTPGICILESVLWPETLFVPRERSVHHLFHASLPELNLAAL